MVAASLVVKAETGTTPQSAISELVSHFLKLFTILAPKLLIKTRGDRLYPVFHLIISGLAASVGRATCIITTALLHPHENLLLSGVGSGQRHQERLSDARRA